MHINLTFILKPTLMVTLIDKEGLGAKEKRDKKLSRFKTLCQFVLIVSSVNSN